MTRAHSLVGLLTSSAILVCAAATAHAQAGQQRAQVGLFEKADPNAAQSLVVEGSIGGGWDTSIAADVEDVVGVLERNEPIPLKGAAHSLFDATIAYSARGRKASFSASAAGNGRYYPSFVEPFFSSSTGKVGFDYKATDATTVNGSVEASYQPFGSLNVFPSAVPPTTLDQAVAPRIDLRASKNDYFSYAARASLSQKISRRDELKFETTWGHSNFTSLGEDFDRKGATGAYSHPLSRNVTLNAQYLFGQTQYAIHGERNIRDHHAEVGLEYSRQRARSRRTSFAFDVGANYVEEANVIKRRASGSIGVIHELARTWLAAAVYRRDVDALPTLSEPFFSDSVTANIVGQLTRRLQVDGSVGASTGALGLATDNETRLRTYYAAAGPTIALSRHIRASVTYDYYYYRFRGNSDRYIGFLPELSRHSISASISVWAPILERASRNASR